MFATDLNDNMRILVKSADSAAKRADIYTRDILLFDKPLSIVYLSFLELVFTVVTQTADSHVYTVETWTGAGAKRIGTLQLFKDGRVVYNDEDVSTTKLRSLYGKCLALKG